MIWSVIGYILLIILAMWIAICVMTWIMYMIKYKICDPLDFISVLLIPIYVLINNIENYSRKR